MIKRSDTRHKHKFGLAFLGQNYMQATEMYQNMADKYFELAKTDKRSLTAAKKCYVIAAENAIQISRLFKDDENPVKQKLMTTINQNLHLAEMIKQKVEKEPACDAKKAFLANFDAVENIIIEKSSTVREKYFEMWSPESGIVK